MKSITIKFSEEEHDAILAEQEKFKGGVIAKSKIVRRLFGLQAVNRGLMKGEDLIKIGEG